jgi:RluA family pseudouridine synthase
MEEAVLSILSRTEHWIAIAKPAGLPSRPGPGHAESALSLLEAKLRAETPEPPRPGVVHRLDRDTSGVLLFSLGPRGHRAIIHAFARRVIKKDYTALVLGWPQPRRGRIDLALRRNASGKVVPDPRGLTASTRYETLGRFSMTAWILAHPLTGRTHQVRVHLAARGTPILGDRLYGPASQLPGIPPPPRLCLHAARLVLPEELASELASPALATFPPGGLVIEAPEPEDLRRYRLELTAGRAGQ